MEKQYLDANALKELIRRVMTGIDPECRDDQDALYDILPSFHTYVDTVVKNEAKLLLNEIVSMGHMEELKNKMLLIGNLDYETFCDRLMPVLEEE